MTAARAAWMTAALMAAGCLSGTRTVPLYPDSSRPRAPDEVATLQGPIATVDGQDVAGKGTHFALLAGCHVVVLLERIGESNTSGTAAWSAHLPHLVYAFRMRAGHAYIVESQTEFGSSTVGRIAITARERDPQGGTTTVSPANSADVEDCQRWKPPTP